MCRAASTNFSRIHAAVAEVGVAQSLARRRRPRGVRRLSGTAACRCRRRPPCSSASPDSRSLRRLLSASLGSLKKPVPGSSGTRFSAASSRAVCFSPNARICSGVGPMKTMPVRFARFGELGVLAQKAIAGMDRLRPGLCARRRASPRSRDSFAPAVAARCRTASSACSTCSECRSASEYTATEADAHRPQRPNDAARDGAAIGDQNFANISSRASQISTSTGVGL